MARFEFTTRVGPDGTLVVGLPIEFADTDVRVSITEERRPMTPEEWRDFLDQTAGSIPDFPDVDRLGRDSYEKREPID
jgi:hypothetical protein